LNLYPEIIYVDKSRQEEIESFLKEWRNPEATVNVRTSGSTGAPKTIVLQKDHMRVSALKTIEFLDLKKGSACYLCLSCTTIAGKMMMVRAMVNSMKIIVGPISSGTLEMLNEKIEFAAIVPLQLERILFHLPEKLKLINKIIVGGAPVSEEIEDELRNEHISIYQTFGMTETISHVALRKIGENHENHFTGLPGINFEVDEQQKLIIHYPEIGINRLETNDIVDLISTNTFKWLGRADFAINSGGIKIIPEIVEKKLSSSIDAPFFVFGLPDSKLGQQVTLLIEGAADDYADLSYASVLEKYEKPKNVFFLPRFIRTESGKINRLETILLISL
jgi:o-succinylbenzoate---CoA ligase